MTCKKQNLMSGRSVEQNALHLRKPHLVAMDERIVKNNQSGSRRLLKQIRISSSPWPRKYTY
jgi:hypothetical protein